MATTKIQMTNQWVEIGTGQLAFSLDRDASGRWQVQALGASATALEAVEGHPIKAGKTLVWDAGSEAVYLKASPSSTASVTS